MTSISTLRQIRQAIDIRRLMPGKWKVSNQVATALCPYHEEKTPSFRANLPGHEHAGRWHCHGCGQKGDVFDIVVETEHCTMPEAISRLAAIAGVQLEGQAPETAKARRARLAAAWERDVAAWWFRGRYRMFRRDLNLDVDGPPELGADLEPIDGRKALAVTMMRWIRLNHRGVKGIEAFRAFGGVGRWGREYRTWRECHKKYEADQMLYADLRLEFTREIMQRNIASSVAAGCKMDASEWCARDPECYRRAVDSAVEIW
jgi:hypothetical protein